MITTTNGTATLKLNIAHWRMELEGKRDDLARKDPVWGPVGKEVYERTYARIDAEEKRETWIETAYRTVLGNLNLVDAKYIETGEAAMLLDYLYNFKIIPAGRHLFSSGVPGRQFLFNCHRAGFTERFSRHFEFVFNELMKGGGVGANYSNSYIQRYPAVQNKVHVRCYIPPEYEPSDVRVLVSRRLVEVDTEERPIYPAPHYNGATVRVPDSREGWYGVLNRVLEASFTGEECYINVDLSMLRSKGSPIKGFGGISSGPWALATLLQNVAEHMNKKVGSKFTSLDFMILDHLISECVVAGNVRRSARMSIKHWKDSDIMEFLTCKTDDKLHWSTNISVEVDDEFWGLIKGTTLIANISEIGKHATAVLEAVVQGIYKNGEPGFVNTQLAAVGERGDIRSTNPCGEIFLEEFENCNLGHVNLGAFFDDDQAAQEAFRLMQRYLIRATFGDITDPQQRAVVNRNRRTGVGIFGYQAWVNKQTIRYSDSWREETGIPEIMSGFKNICITTADKYAKELGIPAPIKHTTIAPTGTIAKMPGTTEGCQTIFSRYFYRRVRYGADDPKVARLFAEGYHVEEDQYTQDTKVVTFPVKDQLVADIEAMGLPAEELVEDASEVSLENFLAVQAMLQERYADNSISLTINFDAEKTSERQIMQALMKYGPKVKGTTLMPEMTRPQMPYERITREEFEETGIGKVGQGDMTCATGACPVR